MILQFHYFGCKQAVNYKTTGNLRKYKVPGVPRPRNILSMFVSTTALKRLEHEFEDPKIMGLESFSELKYRNGNRMDCTDKPMPRIHVDNNFLARGDILCIMQLLVN